MEATERERCIPHGLATGADGQCVLCLREARERDANVSSRRWFLALGAAFAAVIMVGGGYQLLQSWRERAVSPPARATAKVAPVEPDPVPSAPSDPAPRPYEAPRADQGADEADQRAALRAVKVTLYTTSWCPSCKRAKAFMRQNGLSFVDKDVEVDVDAAKTWRRINPGKTIPVVDIEGEVVVGFDQEAIADALQRAAQRHYARRRSEPGRREK